MRAMMTGVANKFRVVAVPIPTGTFSANTSVLNGSTQHFDAGNVNDPASSEFSIGLLFKTSFSGSNQRIISKMNVSNQRGYEIYLTSSQEIRFRLKTDASNTKVTTTANLGLSDGDWHFLLVYSNRAGQATIFIDGDAKSTSYSQNDGTLGTLLVTDPFLIGTKSDLAGNFNGSLGFSYFSLGNDLTSDAEELYNTGIAPCWDILESGTQSKIDTFYDISNWTGHTSQELVNQAGAGTLTNVGTTLFTGTGLTVECLA